MDQLVFAPLSHTYFWYEVAMLKVPADIESQCTVRGRFEGADANKDEKIILDDDNSLFFCT